MVFKAIYDTFSFYDEHRLKSSSQMGSNRLQLHCDKIKNLTQNRTKNEIARMIADRNYELARIRCEHVIRDDFVVEAYSVIKLLLEILSTRSSHITNSKTPPEDLRSAMVTCIWTSEKIDIQELKEVARQLKLKFGNEFYKSSLENKTEEVSERVIQKLSPKPPEAALVEAYMREIAKENNITYKPKFTEAEKPLTAPVGNTVPIAPASGIATAYGTPIVEPIPFSEAGVEVPASIETFNAKMNDDADADLSTGKNENISKFVEENNGDNVKIDTSITENMIVKPVSAPAPIAPGVGMAAATADADADADGPSAEDIEARFSSLTGDKVDTGRMGNKGVVDDNKADSDNVLDDLEARFKNL